MRPIVLVLSLNRRSIDEIAEGTRPLTIIPCTAQYQHNKVIIHLREPKNDNDDGLEQNECHEYNTAHEKGA